ncbi:oligosaccharide flippase family protein [Shewanella chilikensis]|uniref:oligosaccharide flippase family protein n=1 Tax=Shewanella chilikensis TaxID=558541 RepID=UPI003007EA06
MINKNVIYNYISQLYVAFAGVFLLPITLKFLGAEGFGLVTFYIMLQAWVQVFDLGFTPAVSRTVVQFRAGKIKYLDFLSIKYFYETVFTVFLLIGVVFFYVSSDYISSEWLNYKELNPEEVSYAIFLMGVTVFIRLNSGVYRGIISGAEKFGTLSLLNIANVTARFVIILPLLYYYDSSFVFYFEYQLTLSVIELLMLKYFSKISGGIDEVDSVFKFNWNVVKNNVSFSMFIAGSTIIWIITAQLDKLVLSKYLDLSEFSVYGLVVLVCSCLRLVVGPFTTVLLPRLATIAQGDNTSLLLEEYKKATLLVMFIVIPLTSLFTFHGHAIIYLWTQDFDLTNSIMNILPIYMTGSCLMILSAFPYYLQYAHGKLRLHLVGSLVFLCIFTPSLFFLVYKYGAMGGALSWAISNLIFFFLWVPYIHSIYFPGFSAVWFKNCLFPIVLASYTVSYFVKFTFPSNDSSLISILLSLTFTFFAIILTTSLVVKNIREFIFKFVFNFYKRFG